MRRRRSICQRPDRASSQRAEPRVTVAAAGTPTHPRPLAPFRSGGCRPGRACADRPTVATSLRWRHRRPRSRGAVARTIGTMLPPARSEDRTRRRPSSESRPRSTTAAGSGRRARDLLGEAPAGTAVAGRRSGDAVRPTSGVSSRSECRRRRSPDADRPLTETVLPTAGYAARTPHRRSSAPRPRSATAATSARHVHDHPGAAPSRTAPVPLPTAARPASPH
jgi:hypothetical protein